MYRAQWFTQRGVAHHVDFRGKPGQRTDFNFILYGVNDQGYKNPDGTRRPPEEASDEFDRAIGLRNGWRVRGQLNYLSSYQFRQAFTESFFEAIYTEVQSLGHMSNYWTPMRSTSRPHASRRSSGRARSPGPMHREAMTSSRCDGCLRSNQQPRRQITDECCRSGSPGHPARRSCGVTSGLHNRAAGGPAGLRARRNDRAAMEESICCPYFSLRETRYGSSLDTQGR